VAWLPVSFHYRIEPNPAYTGQYGPTGLRRSLLVKGGFVHPRNPTNLTRILVLCLCRFIPHSAPVSRLPALSKQINVSGSAHNVCYIEQDNRRLGNNSNLAARLFSMMLSAYLLQDRKSRILTGSPERSKSLPAAILRCCNDYKK
jgi:hypothetical protein